MARLLKVGSGCRHAGGGILVIGVIEPCRVENFQKPSRSRFHYLKSLYQAREPDCGLPHRCGGGMGTMHQRLIGNRSSGGVATGTNNTAPAWPLVDLPLLDGRIHCVARKMTACLWCNPVCSMRSLNPPTTSCFTAGSFGGLISDDGTSGNLRIDNFVAPSRLGNGEQIFGGRDR